MTFCPTLYFATEPLKFPEDIARAQGLDLLKRLEDHKSQREVLLGMLKERDASDVAAEAEVIRTYLSQTPQAQIRLEKKKLASRAVAKTTFRLQRPEGVAKCTVSDGRVELRLNKDFSGIERQRLEKAVAAFMNALEG